MSNKRLSDLPVAVSLDGSEYFEVVQGGTSKRATAQQIGETGLPGAIPTALGILIDYGTNVVQAGVQGSITVPFDCTLTSVTMLANTSGSVEVDVWKCSYTQYDGFSTHPASGDSICGGTPPAISSTTKYKNTTLTGWGTTFAEGDIIAFNVTGTATSINKLTVSLHVDRTVV